jgi:Mg2+-importing ATPase
VPGRPAQVAAVVVAAARDVTSVLRDLGSSEKGLSAAAAHSLLQRVGPNEVKRRPVRLAAVVVAQLRSPLLGLLVGTSLLSFGVHEHTNATIILVIVAASVSLSSANEYSAARTAAGLQDAVPRRAICRRDGHDLQVDVRDLVPGDVVRLPTGAVVPADLRLLVVDGLRCDESALTGEAAPVQKMVAAVPVGSDTSSLASCALSGTVVVAGHGVGVVVATADRALTGRFTRQLDQPLAPTGFQAGLTRFSSLLLRVALVVSGVTLALNVVLGRPVVDALLFATAIAVGITPQLLPAVVATSLASGSRRLARHHVVVKRLVCIEDLGNMDVLVTDKTGTLTTGEFAVSGVRSVDTLAEQQLRLWALLAAAPDRLTWDEAPMGDPVAAALWSASVDGRDRLSAAHVLDDLPFDHDRRRTSVLIDGGEGSLGGERAGGRSPVLVTTGAPDSVLGVCDHVPPDAMSRAAGLTGVGSRVIAVAFKEFPVAPESRARLAPDDESGLTLAGFITFDDPLKQGVHEAVNQLGRLGVRVVVASGDSVEAVRAVADRVGLGVGHVLDGDEVDALDEEALAGEVSSGALFARVNPEQKARIVATTRRAGHTVGFIGDGVNDALALHGSDVGISVASATDVAREAADVVLEEKSLRVVADAVVLGRTVFANTMKYVLMGTSSNFGNIFSAAAASVLLPFLPMLPSQLLLNNLLYDAGQLTIPTDRVDPEQLAKPESWDIAHIRRFMFFFGPLSSVFDFLTFGVLAGVFHATEHLFQAGWFVESLVTQAAVIFVVRTQRTPFTRSRPGRALSVSVAVVVLVAALVPVTPLGRLFEFDSPDLALYAAIAVLAATYLLLIDQAKRLFYRRWAHPRLRGPHRQTSAARMSLAR